MIARVGTSKLLMMIAVMPMLVACSAGGTGSDQAAAMTSPHSSPPINIGEPFAAHRLEILDAIPFTLEELHWGPKYLRESPERIEAGALLPDGRTAEMEFHPVGEDRWELRIALGRFGDAAIEQQLREVFARELAQSKQSARVQRAIRRQ